jgi:exodeoxyribonuclease-3
MKKINSYKYRYYNTCTARKGYSGTAIWSKKKPINIYQGINNEEHDKEGRVITLEYKEYYLIHVYTPNSGQVLQRLDYRVKKWDKEFWKYVEKLQKTKSVIVCGDLNVAKEEIDLHSPKTNLRSAGFTKEERDSFSKYLKKLKLIDTFRFLYPEKVEYSYWTYMQKAREKNKGWRIDYFLISEKLKNNLVDSSIITNQMGSDHAPVLLKLKL